MEFADVLKRRRMVRNYTGDPVDREAVERIVARARKAPSGGFSQGNRFVVVTDAGMRARIAELAQESKYVKDGHDPWISRAPVHVVVATREDDYHDRYRRADKLEEGEEIEWRVPWWWVDAGKAMMLLLLAAIDEGLGAGLFGLVGDDNDRLRGLLGIPADLEVVGVVTLGHPAPETKDGGSRKKFPWKPLEDVVRWERW